MSELKIRRSEMFDAEGGKIKLVYDEEIDALDIFLAKTNPQPELS